MMPRGTKRFSRTEFEKKLYKPNHGKTNLETLQNLLSDASKIIEHFEATRLRHSIEIDEERKNTEAKIRTSDWTKREAFKRIFETSEPEEFNFDFHELRRSFLIQLDSENPIRSGELFVDICKNLGVGPLAVTLLYSDFYKRSLYDIPADDRSPPKLNMFLFDEFELDSIILKLYIEACEFYGIEDFMSILGYR